MIKTKSGARHYHLYLFEYSNNKTLTLVFILEFTDNYLLSILCNFLKF